MNNMTHDEVKKQESNDWRKKMKGDFEVYGPLGMGINYAKLEAFIQKVEMDGYERGLAEGLRQGKIIEESAMSQLKAQYEEKLEESLDDRTPQEKADAKAQLANWDKEFKALSR